MTPIGMNSSGMPSNSRSCAQPVFVGADEPAAEALVDRREHDVLHRRADVDPPVGDRPVDLGAVVLELVGLLVAAVVDRLGDARDELRGALRDPRPHPEVASYSSSPHSRATSRRRSGSVTTIRRWPWLKPADGVRCASRAIRSITSRSTPPSSNRRTARRFMTTSTKSIAYLLGAEAVISPVRGGVALQATILSRMVGRESAADLLWSDRPRRTHSPADR